MLRRMIEHAKRDRVMKQPSVPISRYVIVGLIQLMIRETPILFIRG